MLQPRLFGALLLVLGCAAPSGAQTLRIFHIDVEQAAATLFVLPSGKTLLVDSGKNGHGARLLAVMKEAGVMKIDAFVATHYHEDHFGGIDDLVLQGQVQVLEAYDRGDKAFLPASKKAQKTYKDYQSTVGDDAIHLTRGMTIALDPEVTITCISSGGAVIGENPATSGKEENDMSISLLITFRGFRFFVGGDIEAFTEAKIAERDLVKDVDIYEANHHGSHSSSARAFMTDLNPTLVVISNGSVLDYKHPRAVSLKTYAGLSGPPVVLQTNKCFHPAPCANVPDPFIADLAPGNGDGGTVRVTVDGASGTYTVAWANAKQQFKVKALPAVAPIANVQIESLLPNPVGADDQSESVTLRNKGSQTIALTGWMLRDRAGLHWDLAGSLAPGQARTFRRNGQSMSLNNAGDEIALLDDAQVVRDRFGYVGSKEGAVLRRQ